ncbi:MAG: peptidoglycan bridge formation glycyltransferase FemA/FemB family protein [Patescibacteria group bacterium]
MEVIRLSENDSAAIKDFLARQEFVPIQQTLAWGKFQEAIGVESFRIGVKEGNELIFYAQGFVKKLPFGLCWLHVPRQLPVPSSQFPEAFDLLISGIQKLAKEKSAIFVRFDSQKSCDWQLVTGNSQLREAGEGNFPVTTLRLDLTKSEEEILGQMKPKGRYNIRIAEKHGVTVRETREPEAAKIFHKLLKKTTARDNFSAHPEAYYESFLRELGESASCFIAEVNGKAIAVSLCTFYGDTVTYYYGASDYEYRDLMAPYLVQWKAISAAKRRGMKFYDFLGIAPEGDEKHHLAGVTSFKKKFGGEIIEYPGPKELVLKPFLYRIFKLAKNLRR